MTDNKKTVWLVDLENTGRLWARVNPYLRPGDLVVLFWSEKSCIIKLDDLSEHTWASFMFVKCTHGTPNAMDFTLSAWLGMYAAANPGYDYKILSNDHGYKPLLAFFKSLQVSLSIISPAQLTPCLEKAAQDAVQQDAAQGIEPAQGAVPDTGPPKKPIRQIYSDKLKDAGLSDPQEVYITATILLESMKRQKNMRRMDAYNRMCAKYGAKPGLIKYNLIKGLIADIAENGPWPGEETAQLEETAEDRPVEEAGQLAEPAGYGPVAYVDQITSTLPIGPADPGEEPAFATACANINKLYKGPTVTDVNSALSAAGIAMSKGLAPRAHAAILTANNCNTVNARKGHLRYAVSELFPEGSRQKAYNVLVKYIKN